MPVHGFSIFCIQKNPCFFWIEPDCNDVQDIVVRPFFRVFQSKIVIKQELFFVRNLEYQVCAKCVLKPLGKKPNHHVTELNWSRRRAACVNIELLFALYCIHYFVKVCVSKKVFASEHEVVACFFSDALKQSAVNALYAKLMDKLVIVNHTRYIVWSNVEFLFCHDAMQQKTV